MTTSPTDRPKPRPRQRTSAPGTVKRAVAARRSAPASRPQARGGSARPAAPRKGRKRMVLRIIGIVAAFLVVAAGVAGVMLYNNLAATLPDPTKPLMGTDLSTRILDRNGKPITTLFADQNRTYVALPDIPKSLQDAVISTEDQRFYEHQG